MFDLMGAIRQRQKNTNVTPCGFCGKPTTMGRRACGRFAENCGAGIFSATIRKNPQGRKNSQTPETQGLHRFSANPQNPQTIEGKDRQNPDAVLLGLANTLKASPARLRALLSDDDMEDIAAGEHSREYLLAYFRLMRSDGNLLAED